MATSSRPPGIDYRPTLDQRTRVNGTSPDAKDRSWHEWMMVGVGLTALLAVLAIVASIVALAGKTATTTTIIRRASGTGATSGMGAASMSGRMHSAGSASSSSSAGASGAAASGAGAVVAIVLQKDATGGVPGTVTGMDGWPRYAPSKITIPAGKRVTLIITNYDDVSTPLASGVPYNKVMGGRETVDGKPVSYVGNKTIAHTFTVTGIGVNIPIPMAPSGGSTTITFTFVAHKAGTYIWQCFTPCGSGKSGIGGPMMKQGFMQGTLTVA